MSFWLGIKDLIIVLYQVTNLFIQRMRSKVFDSSRNDDHENDLNDLINK